MIVESRDAIIMKINLKLFWEILILLNPWNLVRHIVNLLKLVGAKWQEPWSLLDLTL